MSDELSGKLDISDKLRTFIDRFNGAPEPELTGPIVIRQPSMAWLSTVAVVVVGSFAVLVMYLDRSEALVELSRKQAEVAALTAKTDELRANAVAPTPTPTPVAEPIALKASLAQVLKEQDGVEIALEPGRARVIIDDYLLFDKKKIALAKRGEELMKRVAPVLAGAQVEVIAHSDGTGLSRNQSPWGQTAARATSVVRFLEEEAKLDGTKLAATGRGAGSPRPGAAEKSARNRRIELVITP
jgi:flagellar motor protein MotB